MIYIFAFILLYLARQPYGVAAQECKTEANSKVPVCLGINGDKKMTATKNKEQKNVLGTKLIPCGMDPITGFYRTGTCETGPDDRGVHTVCAELTNDFLEFTKSQGNDLSTPLPRFGFPGLKAGQRWCLCAARWAEAEKAGSAPKVILESTHEKTLSVVPLETLKKYHK